MSCQKCKYKKICVTKCKDELGIDNEGFEIDSELEKLLLDRCELNDRRAMKKLKRFYNNKKILEKGKFEDFDWDVYNVD